MENYQLSIHMASWKESMINRLSNLINRNRSAAKISQVLCSRKNTPWKDISVGETGTGLWNLENMAVAIHHKLLFQNHIAITSHRVYKACSWSQVSEWTNNPYWRKKVNRQQINQHSMFKYQIVKQGSHHKSFKSSLFSNVKTDPKPKDLNSIMKCWNWYRAIARTLHNQLAIGSFWAKFCLLNLVIKHTVLI